MSFGDRVVRQIMGPPTIDDHRLPEQEPSELEKAFMNYKQMEQECAQLRRDINELRIENGALTAEVSMLRDALERSDNDRIRLQAVSSTLTGQLRAINAVIGDALRMAIKNGIEAADKAEDKRAGEEARDILERAKTDGDKVVTMPPANQM